jgi:lipoprotein NlpI
MSANPYVPLWRYLARARLGEKHPAELERSLKSIDQTAWPAPVLGLFLGRDKPEAVRAAAAEGDAAGRADRGCEAAFYLGEYALLEGRRDDALTLLRQAGDQCPAGMTERAAARGEAARLAK